MQQFFEQFPIDITTSTPFSLVLQTPSYLEFRGRSSAPYPFGLLFCRLAHEDCVDYFCRLSDGAYIVQLPKHLADVQLSAPVPNCNLPPLTYERLSTTEEVPQRTQRTFSSISASSQDIYSSLPFSEVSLDLYAAYWRRRKAIIGRWIKRKILWERTLSPLIVHSVN